MTVAVATMVALAASGAPACPAEHARYRLRSDPSFVLRMHRAPVTRDWWSGLAIELDRTRTGRVSWWLPTAGDRPEWRWTALAGTPAAAKQYRYPLRALRYVGFGADYAVRGSMLAAGDDAPAHILLDSLRDAFWYGDDPAARESPPPALFDLVACDVPDDRPPVIAPVVP